MKALYKIICLVLALSFSIKLTAQHQSKMEVAVNLELKTLNIKQDLTYHNTTNDTLALIVLNDWNNAFADKNTPLAKRFSDEFYRGFHLAKAADRGKTTIINLTETNFSALEWERSNQDPDYITVKLNRKLLPNEKIVLHLNYIVKIPNDKFTHFGFDQNGGMALKNWFISPARFENGLFVKYNNFNLDDIANAVSDYEV